MSATARVKVLAASLFCALPFGVLDASARGVTPEDLVGLTDVTAVRISPDGRFVAYQTHRAITERDTYESHWWIAGVDQGVEQGGTPVEVGAGGDPQWNVAGVWDVHAPVWSPTSDRIAFLVREENAQGGEVQIHLGTVDGRVKEQLTHNPSDVRELTWSRDGRAILFEVGPTREALRLEARRRKEQGLVFDDNMQPWIGQPRIDPSRTLTGAEIWVYEIASRTERKAAPAEAEEFAQLLGPARVLPQQQVLDDNSVRTAAAVSPDGQWLAAARKSNDAVAFLEFRPMQDAAPARGQMHDLKLPSTRSTINQLWWRPDGREVYFLQAGADDRRELFGGNVRTGATRRISRSNDVLSECSFDATMTRAACLRENLTTPANVAVVDVRDGAVRTLTDLNPAFRSLQVAKPERLDWVNTYGDAAFAHVLKPIDYVPGKKYPLVVVTYTSRGFIRGGTGDEYPAQVFAANGFVVLSFDRPRGYGLVSPKTPQAANTHVLEYASPTSSLEIAVRRLVEQGLVDPARVGGTGLSNGATTICYALTHSKLFSAAAVSNLNGEDPIFYYLSAGNHRQEWRMNGLGGLPDEGPNAARWREVSPALNAKAVSAPILVNAPADEYLMSLQFHHSLMELNKPVELMIYPDEGHIKRQPKHRQFIYQRNLDWFSFWFQERERTTPLAAIGETPQVLADQYARWGKLRELQKSGR